MRHERGIDTAGDLASGKGHRDENFPVASWLIARATAPSILAFYRFARTADDVADHATPGAGAKSSRCSTGWSDACSGADDAEPDARGAARSAGRARARRRAMPLDLLTAFRLDVTKLRYRDWDDLMDYCRYSAMPVGRFVLDVHGEAASDLARHRRALRGPAGDQPSAGLRQGLSHPRPRLYPARRLRRRGPDARGAGRSQGACRAACRYPPLDARTVGLLRISSTFSRQIADLRLALEVAVIQRLAITLTGFLARRDPLSERVHLGKTGFARVGALGVAQGLAQRLLRLAGAKPVLGNAP